MRSSRTRAGMRSAIGPVAAAAVALGSLVMLQTGACFVTVPDVVCDELTKPCGGVCVPIDDPAYGCTFDSCAPCSLPNASAKCTASACVIAQCAEGYGNCDELADNGCEVALQSSAAHCGGCGHDCQGGSCELGVCTPVPIAVDEGGTMDVAFDQGSVYWTNEVDPGACLVAGDLNGGGRTVLDPSITGRCIGLVLDGSYVYWSRNESGAGLLLRMPSGGAPGSGQTIASASSSIIDVLVDGSELFWTEVGAPLGEGMHGPGRIMRAELDGSKPQAVASDLDSPYILATDGQYLYWTAHDTGGIYRVVKGGGTPELLAAGPPVSPPPAVAAWGVAVAAGTAYWLDGAVLRSIVPGGGDSVVAGDQPEGKYLLASEGALLWAGRVPGAPGSKDDNRALMWALADGSEVRVLADSAPGYVHGLATNSEAIYFGTWAPKGNGGGVFRVVRPIWP